MRIRVLMLALLPILQCALVSGQTVSTSADGAALRPDPAVREKLEALGHPFQAQLEANDIVIPAGDLTRCHSYTNANTTDTTCSPGTRFEQTHQLILHSSVNGETVKIIAGCSTIVGDHDCHSFGELGDPSTVTCGPGSDEKVRVCTTKGSRYFQIEADRKRRRYLVVPVEGGKPNRHYKIPLASINDKTVVMDE